MEGFDKSTQSSLSRRRVCQASLGLHFRNDALLMNSTLLNFVTQHRCLLPTFSPTFDRLLKRISYPEAEEERIPSNISPIITIYISSYGMWALNPRHRLILIRYGLPSKSDLECSPTENARGLHHDEVLNASKTLPYSHPPALGIVDSF